MPSYQRQQQNHKTQTTQTEQQNPLLESGIQPEEKSGFLGWMQSAGDWAADKYDNATTGIGKWVDGVTDSAQNVIEIVKETEMARNVFDVMKETDIDRKDGKWNIETDLDEVMDLIPTDKLQLDREASYSAQTGQLAAGFSEISYQDYAFGDITSEQGQLNQLHGKGNLKDNQLSASMESVDIGRSSFKGNSAESIKASGIKANSSGKQHNASMEELQLRNIQENQLGATIGSTNINQVNVGTDLKQLDTTVEHGNISDAEVLGVKIESAGIDGGQASFSKDHTQASIDSMAFKNAEYLNILKLKEGQANSLSVGGNREKQTAAVGGINVQGVRSEMPNIRSNIESASIQGGKVQHDGGGHGTASIDSAKLSGIDLEAQDSKKTGNSYNPKAPAISSEFDSKKLITSLASRVDNANVKSRADLNSGRYGGDFIGATIENGTQLETDLQIKNNQIQNGSKISTTKSVDAPLWTSSDGLYVKDNKMMADVNGWFDVNINDTANKGLGTSGSDLKSISEYGHALVNKPKDNNNNDKPNPVNLSTLALNGNVGLSDGKIDTGGGAINLQGSKQGAN